MAMPVSQIAFDRFQQALREGRSSTENPSMMEKIFSVVQRHIGIGPEHYGLSADEVFSPENNSHPVRWGYDDEVPFISLKYHWIIGEPLDEEEAPLLRAWMIRFSPENLGGDGVIQIGAFSPLFATEKVQESDVSKLEILIRDGVVAQSKLDQNISHFFSVPKPQPQSGQNGAARASCRV